MIARQKSTGCKIVVWLLLGLLVSPLALLADEFRPALLELREDENGWVEVTWKVPRVSGKVLALKPVLPEFM